MTEDIETTPDATEPAPKKPRVLTAAEIKKAWVTKQVVRAITARYAKVREYINPGAGARGMHLKTAQARGYTVLVHPKEQAYNPERRLLRKVTTSLDLTKQQLKQLKKTIKRIKQQQQVDDPTA